MSDELKKNLDEMQGLLHGLKASQDEKEAKRTALDEAKEAKMAEELLKLNDELESQRAETKKLEEAMASLGNITVKEGVTELEQKEILNNFLRNTNDRDAKMAVKAVATNDNSSGGYLALAPEFAGLLSAREFESSPMRQVANVVSGGAGALQFILDDGETSGEWSNEGSSTSVSNDPDVGLVTITAHQLTAKPKATTMMLEDGMFDVAGWLRGKAAEIHSRKEATAFVVGTGNHQPKGFLTFANYTSAGVYQREAIEQILSGASGAVAADGLIDTQNALKESYQANANWFMQRATFGNVRKLKDGENQYLLGMGANGLDGETRLTLLDKPILFADDMPAVAGSALSIAYGDFKQGYTIYDRVGIAVLVDPYTSEGNVIFRVRKRVGGDVTNYEAIKINKITA